MLGLPANRLFPADAQPGQVLLDRPLVLGPAADGVDVLHPQQQPSPALFGQIRVEQRGKGMAEMKVAVRAWGEPEDGLHAGPPDYPPVATGRSSHRG
jgi:hypothetical protein